MKLVLCVFLFGAGVLGSPVPQTRYITAQGPQQVQLLQGSPAQARVAQAIYEGQGLGSRSTAPQSFTGAIPQNVLGSSVDRQVQRVAQVSGPQYLQQIQALQSQAQLTEAQTVTLRRQQGTATLPTRLQQQAQIEAQVVAQRQQQAQAQPQPQYRLVQQAQPQPQIQYVARQPQQVQYVQRPQVAGSRLKAQRPIEEEEPEYDSNTSYQFGFDVKDDLYTNYQNRKEQKDGDKISGSYSVVDSDGYIRTVTYTADPKEGFKAEVMRTPTDIVVKLPTPAPPSGLQQRQQYYQQEPAPARAQGQKQRIVYQYQQEQDQ